MGRTYTDFSQHSKGMFRKSAPVEEIKPLPKTKAEVERQAGDLECQLAAEWQMREVAEDG